MKYKTLWDKHLEYASEMEKMYALKNLGYGATKKRQLRNIRMMEMYFKEGKTSEEVGAEFKISGQAVRLIIQNINKRMKGKK